MKPILLAIAFLLCQVVNGQEKENDAQFNKPLVKFIDLPTSTQKISSRFPIGNISIVDSRFDTTYIGIIPNSRYTQIRLKNGLKNELQGYFSSLHEPLQAGVTGIDLVCCIRRMLLSDHILVENTNQEELASKRNASGEHGGIILTIEFYARQDSLFTPLIRYDTTLAGIHKINDDAERYLVKALYGAYEKVASVDWERRSKGKKVSWNDIELFNSTRLHPPILTGESVKGVYLTYKDFLNNIVSYKDFTVDKSQKGDFLYIKNEKGVDILLTELWGYSDGTDLFIYSASNFFKLYRTGNAFRLYGAKDLTSKRRLRLNFGLADVINPNSNYSKGQTANKYLLVKSYLQLDMDSGELY